MITEKDEMLEMAIFRPIYKIYDSNKRRPFKIGGSITSNRDLT